jgi:hypothetical protein
MDQFIYSTHFISKAGLTPNCPVAKSKIDFQGQVLSAIDPPASSDNTANAYIKSSSEVPTRPRLNSGGPSTCQLLVLVSPKIEK